MTLTSDKVGAVAIEPFNYGAVDTETADFARQAVGRIKTLERAAAVDIGRELMAVKGRLGHGHFLAWIAAEFVWSRRTATNMMQVAQEFGDDWEKIAHLPKMLQYRIASPSSPQIVRDLIHAQSLDALMDVKTVTATLNGYQVGAFEANFVAKYKKPKMRARLLAKIKRNQAVAAEAELQKEAHREKIRAGVESIRTMLGDRLSEFQGLISELGSDVIVEVVCAISEPS